MSYVCLRPPHRVFLCQQPCSLLKWAPHLIQWQWECLSWFFMSCQAKEKNCKLEEPLWVCGESLCILIIIHPKKRKEVEKERDWFGHITLPVAKIGLHVFYKLQTVAAFWVHDPLLCSHPIPFCFAHQPSEWLSSYLLIELHLTHVTTTKKEKPKFKPWTICIVFGERKIINFICFDYNLSSKRLLSQVI